MKYTIVMRSGTAVVVDRRSDELAKMVMTGAKPEAINNFFVGTDWMLNTSEVVLIYPSSNCEVINTKQP